MSKDKNKDDSFLRVYRKDTMEPLLKGEIDFNTWSLVSCLRLLANYVNGELLTNCAEIANKIHKKSAYVRYHLEKAKELGLLSYETKQGSTDFFTIYMDKFPLPEGNRTQKVTLFCGNSQGTVEMSQPDSEEESDFPKIKEPLNEEESSSYGNANTLVSEASNNNNNKDKDNNNNKDNDNNNLVSLLNSKLQASLTDKDIQLLGEDIAKHGEKAVLEAIEQAFKQNPAITAYAYIRKVLGWVVSQEGKELREEGCQKWIGHIKSSTTLSKAEIIKMLNAVPEELHHKLKAAHNNKWVMGNPSGAAYNAKSWETAQAEWHKGKESMSTNTDVKTLIDGISKEKQVK